MFEKKLYIKLIIPALLISIHLIISSCIQHPNFPDDNNNQTDTLQGAYILCEGLWHYDNSMLSRYNFQDKSVIVNFFSFANPGLRLGDLANHIFLYKDKAYIVVSTAQTIECINTKDGKHIGRIKLEGNRQPREIFIFNDSVGFVSDLYTHSVVCFHPQNLQIIEDNISCGPAPEAIVGFKNYLLVANSGYGDYLAHLPKAGTISIIDIESRKEIKNITCGPNTCEVIINQKRNCFYGIYYNLPSKYELDSLGGIIEYEMNTFEPLRHWRVNARSVICSSTGDSLFFLNNLGVFIIDLNENSGSKQIIKNNNQMENWYAIALCPKDNTIWVCNSGNYQIEGKVMVFDFIGNLLHSFKVGVNPAQVVFF